MFKMIFTAMVLCFGITVSAADYSKDSDTDLKVKTKTLTSKRKDVELKMHVLRVDLIKTNPSIKALHKKIMAMHKELAIKIDNTSAMRKLRNSAENIDIELYKIEKEQKKRKK